MEPLPDDTSTKSTYIICFTIIQTILAYIFLKRPLATPDAPSKETPKEAPKETFNQITTRLYLSPGYVAPACNSPFTQTTDPTHIKIISYNILASTYSGLPYKSEPARGRRISDLVLAEMPEICCMQEVDSIMNHFDNVSLSQHYEFLKQKRPDHKDGLLTLYKSSRFNLVQTLEYDYNSEFENCIAEKKWFRDGIRNQKKFLTGHALQILHLEDKLSRKNLLVANTHLEWDPQNDDVKYFQLTIAFKKISELMREGQTGEREMLNGFVLAGDFNSMPKSNCLGIPENAKPAYIKGFELCS